MVSSAPAAFGSLAQQDAVVPPTVVAIEKVLPTGPVDPGLVQRKPESTLQVTGEVSGGPTRVQQRAMTMILDDI